LEHFYSHKADSRCQRVVKFPTFLQGSHNPVTGLGPQQV